MNEGLFAAFGGALHPSGSTFGVIAAKNVALLEEECVRQQALHREPPDHNTFVDGYYDFSVARNPAIQSVFIVATPSPFHVLRADGDQGRREVIVPPIYGDRGGILENVKRCVESVFGARGFHSWPVLLPKKPLAVHSGLGRYGNNGLAYVNGMGSYHRLTAFASDVPCDGAVWHELSMLPTCASCGKCVKNCPGNALRPGTPWVDTGRCLTAWNEKAGPFPAWVPAGSFDCLVGCVRCQTVCPHNAGKDRRVFISVPNDFIDALFRSDGVSPLPENVRVILERLNLDRYAGCLGRNIRALP